MGKIVKNVFGNFLIVCLIFLLTTAWMFSGWPRIWQNPPIPPKIQEAQAAITLRGTPKLTGGTNGANITLTFDTGGGAPQTGDVVIFFGGHGCDGVCTSIGPSTAGYTLATSTDGADVQVGAWYKVMLATPDLTVVGLGGEDGGDSVAYGAYVIDGTTLDAAIFDQTPVKVGQVTGVPNAPAIVTQTAGAMVIALAGGHLTDATPGTITGYTNDVNAAPNDTDDITLAAATKIVASSGTEDPAAWSSWTSANYIAITIALKPAPNNPPSLTVSTPPLEGASVTAGETYNITYTLSDAEETVTATFFYDLDGSGLDGTAISGCEAKDEGTDLTCSWDTTGVTPETYYVYATTTDGVNPEVNDYSPGELTINVATVSCDSSPVSTSFGELSSSATSTASPNASTTMTCDFAGGCTLYVQDAGNGSNPGLATTSPAYLIPSNTATLSIGSEGYGIQATTTSVGLTLNSIYDKSGNDVGGLFLTATELASSSAAITGGEVLITHMAAISETTPPGNYEDTITYSCAGN